MPSEQEKRLIAYALARLQRNESAAAVEDKMATDSSLPRLSPTEIRDAVNTAVIYRNNAIRLRAAMAPELPGVPSVRGKIGGFAGPGGVVKQYVGLTVYFTVQGARGRTGRGSVVVNVWSEADIGAVQRAVADAITSGKISFRHGSSNAFIATSRGATIEVEVATITPYTRRQGVTVATKGF